ncbi:MAG: long-chain fatty acid--CoA ligase [Ramlibacter sp.]|nr:long-chain fatty acid--CoA ligase [Ramlibacter sp.]
MSFYMTQALHRAMQQKPDAVATVFGERTRTWRELGGRVARLAAGLRGLGVRPGDRVGILSLNSDRYLEVLFATWWCGGVINPVNIRWSPVEIAYSLDDCDTRVLVVDDMFSAMVPALREKSKSLGCVIHAGDKALPAGLVSCEALVESHPPMADAGRRDADLAGVLYTGGTTGFPKGVMLSHANLFSSALAVLGAKITDGDAVFLLAAPMFHVAAIAVATSHGLAAGRFVIVPMFTPEGFCKAAQAHRATHTFLVPTMIQMLIDYPERGSYDLSSLASMAYGASPIQQALLDRAMAALPQVGFMQAYGMTELAPLVSVLSTEHHGEAARAAGRTRSAGRAVTTVEVRIAEPGGDEVARGTVGEIMVRGPGVMRGYWNREEETRKVLDEDGWYRSGDGAYMDDEGFIYIVDRVKDMIVTGGENVYSAEVENALAGHPSVAACAVIAVPSEQWGEAVHAVVVARGGQDAQADELIAFCKERLAGYKCPRSIEFRDALPLSGAGKVLKTKLREPHWAGHERQVG